MVDRLRSKSSTPIPRCRDFVRLGLPTVGLSLLTLACGQADTTAGSLIYSSNRGEGLELYSLDLDDGHETRLTHNNFFDGHPDWSPDGQHIVFTSDGDNDPMSGQDGFELYTMASDGTDIVRLTYDDAYQGPADWSPDGSSLVFDGSDPTGTLQVFVMSLEPLGAPSQITSGSIHGIPVWSPDGTRIAYISIESDMQEISIMDADGTNQTNLTNNPNADVLPAWSPDGTRIAFVSDRDGQWEIYTMDIDGANQTRITDEEGEDADPAWSPDGTRILFKSDRGGVWDIYSMNSDGTDVRLETDDPAADYFPDWSDSTNAIRTGPKSGAADYSSPSVPQSLVTAIESVVDSTAHRYHVTDDRGREMDTLKIITNPATDGFIGVYHSYSPTDGYTVGLATSADLMSWTWRANLAAQASMPTISVASDGGYVVGWEQEPLNHLRLAYYPTWDELLSATPSKSLDVPRRLSSCAEGTPNLYEASSSRVEVGFHYYARCEVDREARGSTDWKSWSAATQPRLDAPVLSRGVAGAIGDRDSVEFDGVRFMLIEGQAVLDDWSSWRVFLVGGPDAEATPVEIRTHAGSTAFANPTVSTISLSGRAAIVVTLFIPDEGAKDSEAGELIYYRLMDE